MLASCSPVSGLNTGRVFWIRAALSDEEEKDAIGHGDDHLGGRVMAEFFASGRVAELILLMLVLEGAGLWLFHRLTGKGIAFRAILPFLLAGAAFALSLRAALTGGGWPLVALPLMGAFAAHLWDIAARWRR